MIANTRNLFVIASAAATAFAQGSLTPPTGPAPSMKTLGQIEPRVIIEKAPFKISASGSYYLATNLFATTDQAAISIDADNVTLDLQGFVISGAPDSAAGITVVPGHNDVTIRNGAIAGTGSGIEASSTGHIQLESLRISKCAESGISVGPASVLANCVSSGNGSVGIRAGVASSLSNCQAIANGGNGLDVDQKCTIRDSTAAQNAMAGVSAGDFSKVINVSATDNQSTGINGGVGIQITDCTADANKVHGISAGRLTTIMRSHASWNAYNGINTDDGVTVADCGSSGNGAIGIAAGNTAHLSNCKADSNGGGGITALKGSTVRDCSAQHNGNDGIAFTDQCVVSRNNANANSNLKGAAGIHAKGTDNVIQENSVTANDRGIAMEAGGNFVVKNTATNNSLNFFTTGDQLMGPVVSTFDGTDPINPMSNFIY